MIKYIGKEELEDKVMKSDKLCLVDFFAEWCGPCSMLSPVLEELDKEFEEKLEIYKIDIDKDQEAAITFDVEVVPTLIFIKNGKTILTETGFKPIEELRRIVEENI